MDTATVMAATGSVIARRTVLAGAAALAACTAAPHGGADSEEQRLNLYTWDTYTPPAVLARFERETGIAVNVSLYGNNDELFARLRGGNPGFDVVVPSNEFVTRMRVSGLLQRLDHQRLPNLRNLFPQFQNPSFDPGRVWSVPYTWLVLGVGFRRSAMTAGVPDSWRWLFDSARYAGRIGLFAEADDLIRLGAKYLGVSVDAVTPGVIEKVTAMLSRQKKYVKVFHHDEGQDLLLSREVDIVLEYNGDIAQVMAEDADLGFVVPREGTLINSDCLCIPAGAPRPLNAHRFIDFVLATRTGAEISTAIRYPTPNRAAYALMPADYRLDPVIFPPADRLARSEYGDYRGQAHARAVDEAITRVLVA